MGGVAGKAGEGAVEVASGAAAPSRELLYHVKVVLLHLVFLCVRMRGILRLSPTLQKVQGTIFLFCMTKTFWQGFEQNAWLLPS